MMGGETLDNDKRRDREIFKRPQQLNGDRKTRSY